MWSRGHRHSRLARASAAEATGAPNTIASQCGQRAVPGVGLYTSLIPTIQGSKIDAGYTAYAAHHGLARQASRVSHPHIF